MARKPAPQRRDKCKGATDGEPVEYARLQNRFLYVVMRSAQEYSGVGELRNKIIQPF